MSIVKSTLALNSSGIIPVELNFSRSSSATRINSIGLIETIPANTIRQDYFSDPTNIGRHRGWLLEESSTNTCLQSHDLGNASWITTTSSLTNTGSVSTNAIKSPDGATNADQLVASSTTTGIIAARQQGLTFTSGTTYTVSVFAKKKELNFLELSNKDNDQTGRTYAQTFNLSTGETGASGGTVDSASIQAYANGWYRCKVTFTADANSDTELYMKARPDNGVSNTYATTSSQGIYLWGMQVEEKAYATSYIATTTVSVTRTADVAFVEDTEGKWNFDVGASFLIDATPLNTTGTPVYHYQDASNANYVTLLSNSSLKVVSSGNSQLNSDPFATGFSNTSHEDFRNVVAMKSNRLHMGQNGSLSANLPDTTVVLPANTSTSSYTIKFFHGEGLTSGSGWLTNFKIYSNVLTDIELQNSSFRRNDDAQNLELNAVQILDNSLTESKLADGAVTSQKILDGTIVTGDIAAGGIQTANIGDDQVTNAKIAAGAVGGTEIANNSITSAHLGLDVIVAEDVANNAITVAELANNAVSTDKIQANAVDGTKIAIGSDAAGDILYYNGTDYTRLAKGTAGQVLTINSGASAPEWASDSTDVGGTSVGGDVSGTVSNIQINANAVTSNEIAANAVDTSEIATNAVGITELDVTDGSAGQLLSTNGSGVLSFITDPTNVGATSVGGDLSGTVSNAQIVAGAVDTTELADDSVTAAKLDSNAVVTASIVDANITTAKLEDDSVTSAKLADHVSNDALRSVDSDHIKNDAIDARHISDDSVDGNALADNSVTSAHIVNGTIVEADIADSAVTNNKIAGTAVSNSKLATNAVTTTKIADNQVTIAKLAVTDGTNGQILSTDGNGVLSFVDDTDTTIGDASVGGDVSGTISNIQISAGAVDTTEIADGAITNAKLGANSITSDKIQLDIIVAEDLAANSVTFSELQDGAVRTAKIQANAVDGTKIAMGSDARGDILYYNGTDYARLAKGSAGEVLTMGANDPAWSADSTDVGGTSVGGDVSGTISNIQINANAIGSSELANNSVTGSHIALGSDAAGDVMYYNGTDYVRLAKGTAGQVLTINSGATAPEWAADSTNVGNTAVGGDVSGTISNIQISAGVVTPTMLSATGTANNTTFLRGDGVWATPTMTEVDPTAVTMAIALG